MKFITLEMVKKHARIEYDDEDDLIEMYCESAEDTILGILNRSYDSIIEEYGDIPPVIRHTTAELAADSFTHRTPSSPTALHLEPYHIDFKLRQYMIL